MTRLRKVKKLEKEKRSKINKLASSRIDLTNEPLNSGDVIGIAARIVNWKPWYQVYIEYDTGVSSFYDGPDVNRAFNMYKDLLLAFKGVKVTEEFVKQIPKFEKQIEMFTTSPRDRGMDNYYHNLLMKKPSFLGF